MAMQSGVKVKIEVFIDTTRLSFREKLILLGKVGAAMDRNDAAEIVGLGQTETLDMKEVKRQKKDGPVEPAAPIDDARPDDADEPTPADEPGTPPEDAPVEDEPPAFVPGQRRRRAEAAE